MTFNARPQPNHRTPRVRPGFERLQALDAELMVGLESSEAVVSEGLKNDIKHYAVDALAVVCRLKDVDPDKVVAIVRQMDQG